MTMKIAEPVSRAPIVTRSVEEGSGAGCRIRGESGLDDFPETTSKDDGTVRLVFLERWTFANAGGQALRR